MSTILECAVDAEAFALGRLFTERPGATVRLEQVVPTGARPMPYLRAGDDDLDGLVAAIRADPSVRRVRRLGDHSGWAICHVAWTDAVAPLPEGIAAADGSLVEATGAEGAWRLTIRFPGRDALTAFREHCEDQGLALDVRRISSQEAPVIDATYGLTGKQREALRTALQEGYFDVPRRITQKELAAELGVQSSAVSETLRRATAELIGQTLLRRRER